VQDAVGDSAKASEQAATASGKAEEAAKRAEATAKVTESQLRRIEVIVAGLQESLRSTPKSTPTENDLKKLSITINGSMNDIRFSEGPTPYETVKINQSMYDGVIYVPKGFYAEVTGSCSMSTFYIDKELKGRVIDGLKGSMNDWVQR